MKKPFLIAAALFLIFLVVVGVMAVVKAPESVAFICVVDTNGVPIQGATITPDGLRPKKGGGHYGWHAEYPRAGVKPVTGQTDRDGFAKIVYPFYVHEKLETGEISFAVDHPDFCAQRPFRIVASAPPQNARLKEKAQYLFDRLRRKVSSRPDPVVLKSGAIVKVLAYVGSKEHVVTNAHVEISRMWPAGTNYWRRDGPLLWTRKASEGKTFLRAVSFPENGPLLFSDAVSFHAKVGETNSFELELKPGTRVTGRLDDTVPRPVQNGRVCIHVYMDQQTGSTDAPIWVGWRVVEPDGTFTFESLPMGRLEIMGLCDGFLSQNGVPISGTVTSQRIPQTFELREAQTAVMLVMEPAASCAVTVLNDAGQPLAGASARFWPNILWGGNGSTIFGSDVLNKEDFFRGNATQSSIRIKAMEQFRATTDAQGIALVRNLPPGNQSYAVLHTNYDMPILRVGTSAERSASVSLTAGETGRVTVTMQKKGIDALAH